MRTFNQIDGVGVIWWRRDEYPQVLKLMSDAPKLSRSFDEWQARANDVISMIRRQGGNPIQVDTTLDKFMAYCTLHGLRLDARGRARFAADPANWPARSKH